MSPSSSSLTIPKEQDADFYSSLGQNYEAAFGHDQGLMAFTRIALSYLPSQCHALDVGCGTGKPVAMSVVEAGHKITGIDISDVMVRLSQKAVPAGTFEVADMRTYGTDGRRFDAVFNMLSLFALRRHDIELMAKRWNFWLPDRGTLAIGTVAAEDCHPESKGVEYDQDQLCARGIPFRFMSNDITLDLFTRDGWHKLLVHNGFEIVETMTDLFTPPADAGCDPEPHYFIVARKVKDI